MTISLRRWVIQFLTLPFYDLELILPFPLEGRVFAKARLTSVRIKTV